MERRLVTNGQSEVSDSDSQEISKVHLFLLMAQLYRYSDTAHLWCHKRHFKLAKLPTRWHWFMTSLFCFSVCFVFFVVPDVFYYLPLKIHNLPGKETLNKSERTSKLCLMTNNQTQRGTTVSKVKHLLITSSVSMKQTCRLFFLQEWPVCHCKQWAQLQL